jgi:hypothetical protein
MSCFDFSVSDIEALAKLLTPQTEVRAHGHDHSALKQRAALLLHVLHQHIQVARLLLVVVTQLFHYRSSTMLSARVK